MAQDSFREKLVKSYYSKEGGDEKAVAWRVIRDIKFGLVTHSYWNICYNIGNFFLAFEDLIRKDPSDIFSQNMHELINVVMPVMCTKNNPHRVNVEAHQDK